MRLSSLAKTGVKNCTSPFFVLHYTELTHIFSVAIPEHTAITRRLCPQQGKISRFAHACQATHICAHAAAAVSVYLVILQVKFIGRAEGARQANTNKKGERNNFIDGQRFRCGSCGAGVGGTAAMPHTWI